MALSPIYNWPEPDNTSLVKNGAQAMRDLGNAIDTTMGTMVAKTVVDAKGDLIAGTAADTVNRLAVGNNGETLVADSSTSTGLRYQGNYAAGKNKIINGDFSNWQRSTNVTVTADATYYAPDRFASYYNQGGATVTWSRQTFTPGTAPVAGYEGAYFNRLSGTSGSGTTEMGCLQKIEDVRTFAGQTATLSFWAKTDSARTANILSIQNFGSGGSGSVTVASTAFSVTTSWTRYTFTLTVPSISGKTIGTNSFLSAYVVLATGNASGSPVLDTWGWQLEAGSVATAFQTATGTIQGELSACLRYYWRVAPYSISGGSGGSAYARFGSARVISSTVTSTVLPFPVPMRTSPTSIEGSGTASNYAVVAGSVIACSAVPAYDSSTQYQATFTFTVASGLTAGQAVEVGVNNGAAAYLGFSAEL
jgi:hypothetical protein